jgi:hypothetical protein
VILPSWPNKTKLSNKPNWPKLEVLEEEDPDQDPDPDPDQEEDAGTVVVPNLNVDYPNAGNIGADPCPNHQIVDAKPSQCPI